MNLRITRRLALVLLGVAAVAAGPRPGNAGPVLHTLELSRPGLAPNAARDPSLLGPGGARRYAGAFTETPYAPGGGLPGVNTIVNAVVLRNPPGCGPAVVVVSGDSLYLFWGTNCVDAGEAAIVQFTANDSTTGCGTGEWRDASNLVLDEALCAPAGAPGVTPRTVAVLAALLAVGGAWAARRARTLSPRSVRSRA